MLLRQRQCDPCILSLVEDESRIGLAEKGGEAEADDAFASKARASPNPSGSGATGMRP